MLLPDLTVAKLYAAARKTKFSLDLKYSLM